MRKSALDPLLPRTLQGLLAATCLASDRSWYLSDLAKRLGRTPSSLQQPLAQLVEAGILRRWRDGNRVYFQADPDCPFLPEIQGLMAKTVGLVDVLRDGLKRLRSRIQVAFVYGSVARGRERSTSDVDLLVIGEATLRELSGVLARIEEELRRPVNATVYSSVEYQKRLHDQDHFLRAVLDRDKLFVVGSSHELAAMARRGARGGPSDDQAGNRRAAVRGRKKPD